MNLNILYLTPSVPYPPHSGGQLRSWHFLRYLAGKGKVTLVAIGNPVRLDPQVPELKNLCDRILFADPEKFKVSQSRTQKLIRLQPWLLDDVVDDEILRQIEQARPEEYDLIVIRYVEMAYHFLTNVRLKGLLNKTIVDVDDMDTIILEREFREMQMSYKKFSAYWDLVCLKHYYRKLRPVRACFVAGEKDKDHLIRNRINTDVFVVPNTYAVNGRDLSSTSNTGPEILFCGTLSYPPNHDALFYFCNRIFPTIREAIPEVNLTVIGKNATEEINRLGDQAGITVAGYVPSVDPYYEKTSIVVVPLLNGAGTRIKILEAMAFQRPVVSTSIGAEGLEVTDGKDILIADEPNEFAQKCIKLLKSPDKRRSLVSNAYRLVKEKYDLPVFYQAMDKIFETIMNGGFKNA
jgi:glycosyltransferase involved in cell wall biosynthesis